MSVDYIDDLVDKGKLYLFQIYSKDFSLHSKGKPNLHTMYWKALFDQRNLEDVVYKLNGKAEIFYRKKSIDDEGSVVHRAKEAITNKNPLNVKKQSTFVYDIIKDKRYTVDKFQFHVPIMMNFKAEGKNDLNIDVLNYLKDNSDVNIIGVDRGERHLIYVSLINQKGEILEQFTLNEIANHYKIDNGNDMKVCTSYHTLLDAKEKERDNARKNWGTIETIKELKEGYISQVVHKIARMMVKYNAIVVMEDLNFGFKRGRFKVEKQVYQKFEKMLVDKLNYLVFKEPKKDQPSLYNAFQLTNKFKSFRELGKQTGFLFYVPAWNTSKIDPTTGFVDLFYLKYESVSKAQQFFKKFESIRYNVEKGYFEFTVNDYSEFNPKAEGTKLDWVICTYGERIKTFRNSAKNKEWDNERVNLTEQFKKLFDKFNVVYARGEELQMQIANKDEKIFFEKLLSLLRLTLQMRNSMIGSSKSEDDYLISPVRNSGGLFYDSRRAHNGLPRDADGNGAYHIAKKGLWILEEINKSEGSDWKKLKLAISNKEWLNFAQNRNLK